MRVRATGVPILVVDDERIVRRSTGGSMYHSPSRRAAARGISTALLEGTTQVYADGRVVVVSVSSVTNRPAALTEADLRRYAVDQEVRRAEGATRPSRDLSPTDFERAVADRTDEALGRIWQPVQVLVEDTPVRFARVTLDEDLHVAIGVFGELEVSVTCQGSWPERLALVRVDRAAPGTWFSREP